MVDAAAEHDQPNALSARDPVVRVDAADDAAREVAGNLHYGITAAGGVGKGNQVAFVMLVGVVAKGRAKFAGGMYYRQHFARRGCTVDVNVERRHEDRDAPKLLTRWVAR